VTEDNQTGGMVVEIGTSTVRMNPVGFSLYAEEFFLAGASIPQNSRARGNTTFTPVPYYLFCRALELVLKAFLLAKHHSLDELKKKYGHDLEALWRAATKEGILDIIGASDPHFESDLQSANSYYKGKAFEYFDFRRWAHGYPDLPPFARFRDDIRRIVEKTKGYCFSVS
jgi:hypothetical protein